MHASSVMHKIMNVLCTLVELKRKEPAADEWNHGIVESSRVTTTQYDTTQHQKLLLAPLRSRHQVSKGVCTDVIRYDSSRSVAGV